MDCANGVILCGAVVLHILFPYMKIHVTQCYITRFSYYEYHHSCFLTMIHALLVTYVEQLFLVYFQAKTFLFKYLPTSKGKKLSFCKNE
jgi:hypothetical protein